MRRLLTSLALLGAVLVGLLTPASADPFFADCRVGIKCSSATAPTLDLNFLAMGNADQIDSRISFSRASTATYFNSSGTLSTAASGVPRFDYNPSTLALNGLLIEQSSTNLLLQSNTFNTTWTSTNVVVASAAATSPDGTNDAWSVADNSASSYHQLIQGVTVSSGAIVSLSWFLKQGTARYVNVALVPQVGTYVWATFDTQTGTITQTGASGTGASYILSSVQSVGSGWYRVTLVGAISGLTQYSPCITISNSATPGTALPSYVGTGTTILAYGAQYEQLAFSTSYIPTTTATVTRAADVATVATSAFPFAQGQGTLQAKVLGEVTPGQLNTDIAVVVIDDGTTSNYVRLYGHDSDNSVHGQQIVASSPTFDQGIAGLWLHNVTINGALAYSAVRSRVAANGSLSTAGAGNVPASLTTLRLGVFSNGSSPFSGWFQRVRYWNSPANDNALQAISAGSR